MVLARRLNLLAGENIPLSPLVLAWGRWALVLLFTLPWLWQYRHHFRDNFRLLIKGWKALLVLAFTGITGYNSFAYIALQYTTATNAVLLNSFIPIMTVFLGWLCLRRAVSMLQCGGILVSFLGVMVIVSQGDFSRLWVLAINRGDVWMLLAVVDWAIYTLALKWHPKVPPMFLLSGMTALGLIMLTPWSVAEYISRPPFSWSVPNLVAVLYVGIFPGFLGYVFYNRGIREVGANIGSLFIHLMPVFGALLSFIFLGERLFLYHFVGITAIFCGIALNVWKRSI